MGIYTWTSFTNLPKNPHLFTHFNHVCAITHSPFPSEACFYDICCWNLKTRTSTFIVMLIDVSTVACQCPAKKLNFSQPPVSKCKFVMVKRMDGSTYRWKPSDCGSSACKYSSSYIPPKEKKWSVSSPFWAGYPIMIVNVQVSVSWRSYMCMYVDGWGWWMMPRRRAVTDEEALSWWCKNTMWINVCHCVVIVIQ